METCCIGLGTDGVEGGSEGGIQNKYKTVFWKLDVFTDHSACGLEIHLKKKKNKQLKGLRLLDMMK